MLSDKDLKRANLFDSLIFVMAVSFLVYVVFSLVVEYLLS